MSDSTPTTPPTVGSPEADAARAEAVTASEEAVKRGGQAVVKRQADTTACDETNALWQQRKDVILAANQQHYEQCYLAIIAALIHLTDMRAFIETGLEHVDVGDGDMRDGDALPDPPTMPKVMAYMSAKAHYTAAKQTYDMAIAEHQIIVSQLEIANSILVLYG